MGAKTKPFSKEFPLPDRLAAIEFVGDQDRVNNAEGPQYDRNEASSRNPGHDSKEQQNYALQDLTVVGLGRTKQAKQG